MSTYIHKRDKYQKKLDLYWSKSGGAKSLEDTDSSSYLDLVATYKPDKITIPIKHAMVTRNFPPDGERQWDGLVNTITGYFTELFHKYSSDYLPNHLPPLFVLLGFSVDFAAQKGDTYGPGWDKHALVFSLIPENGNYTLELFNANGYRNNEGKIRISHNTKSLAYRQIFQLVKKLQVSISETDWFQELVHDGLVGDQILRDQFRHTNLNVLRDGHCDLFSICYIEGRFRFPKDQLLDHLEAFNNLPVPVKERRVRQRNTEIHQKHIPANNEFSLNL